MNWLRSVILHNSTSILEDSIFQCCGLFTSVGGNKFNDFCEPVAGSSASLHVDLHVYMSVRYINTLTNLKLLQGNWCPRFIHV